MHALGNDFMVIDGVRQKIAPSFDDIRAWGRRDTGIGFDQCLLVEPCTTSNIDFLYRIFNADGHEVGQCGNGARCVARFIHRQGLSDKTTLRLKTSTTTLNVTCHQDDTVSVAVGRPHFAPQDIPLQATHQANQYAIPLASGDTIHVHALSVGNPHAVLLWPHLTQAPVQQLGKEISEHPLFPEQTNVEFMSIETPKRIHLRVYERGCGETQACGSGALAAVAAGQRYHHLADTVTVCLPGGELTVTQDQGSLIQRGPAMFVYEGLLTR